MKPVLVIKHSLAKLLLREGYSIKDLVPKKNDDKRIKKDLFANT